MAEEKQIQIEVTGDLDTRKGSYANVVFITSQPNEDILDSIVSQLFQEIGEA